MLADQRAVAPVPLFREELAVTFALWLRRDRPPALRERLNELLEEGRRLGPEATDGLEEIASTAVHVNDHTENIGARRLFTIMERLLEQISFDAPVLKEKKVRIDAKYVKERLRDVVKDEDLSRFIL